MSDPPSLLRGHERSSSSAPVRYAAWQSGETLDETPAFSGGAPARRWLPSLSELVAGLLLSLAALALGVTRLTGDHTASDRSATPTAAAPCHAPQAEERPRTNGRRFARAPSREPRSSLRRPRTAGDAAPLVVARLPASSPASVFVSLPVRGASHYKVEFLRSRRKVFEATTAKAARVASALDVQGRRFEVTPGKYRWLVRPGFGARSSARYGTTIVASRWTVSA